MSLLLILLSPGPGVTSPFSACLAPHPSFPLLSLRQAGPTRQGLPLPPATTSFPFVVHERPQAPPAPTLPTFLPRLGLIRRAPGLSRSSPPFLLFPRTRSRSWCAGTAAGDIRAQLENRVVPTEIGRAGELLFFPEFFPTNFRMNWCPLAL